MLSPISKGYISYGFKDPRYPSHLGVDIGWIQMGLKDPEIYAWEYGIVVRSLYDSRGGNIIVISHDMGDHVYITRYIHLKTRDVVVGDRVERGQRIGIGGNTGTNTTGAHLHFELWTAPKGYVYSVSDISKYAVDPVPFIFKLAGQDLRGGFTTMNITKTNFPIAKPTITNLRMRTRPVIVAGNVLSEHVPPEGLPVLGITDTVGGHKWAQLWYKGIEAWASMSYLTIEEKTVTKEVLPTVTTTVPITGGSIAISIKPTLPLK
jgi:hypothetical protein